MRQPVRLPATQPAAPATAHPAGATELQVLRAMAHGYYEAVPLALRTYCALTAAISQAALARLGFAATLEPCQIWYLTENHNYVIGFLGKPRLDHKWDGHVACRLGPYLLDAATAHFSTDFGLEAPSVAYARTFDAPTHVLARLDLPHHAMLWWLHPPEGAATQVPQEPADLVQRHAEALAAHVRAVLAAGADSGPAPLSEPSPAAPS